MRMDDSRSVQIGLRTTNDEPMNFNILDSRWVHKNGPDAVAAEVKRIVGDNKVYLTFDIDCLDPSLPTRRWRFCMDLQESTWSAWISWKSRQLMTSARLPPWQVQPWLVSFYACTRRIRNDRARDQGARA